MKLGSYIHALLLDHETVIIPDFGAFISNYKPSVINEETNEIIPPEKEIIFNGKIRNNDGLLVGYVSREENISQLEAMNEIEEERENIIYRLDKGEKIILENTGELVLGEDNEIYFNSFEENQFLLDSFGLEPVSLEEEDFDDDQSVVPASESEDELKEKQESKEKEISEETQADEKYEKENIVAISEFLMARDRGQEERKRKIGWLWLLLILIPLIGAGIFLLKDKFTNKSSNVDYQNNIVTEEKPQVKNNEIFNTPLATDTLKSNSTDSLRNDKIENQENEIEGGVSNKFYLVGGSFKEVENANKFIEQFNAEGYEPSLLGKRGNFYIVIIGTYSTEKEAVIARDSFKEKNPGSEAWVPDNGVF